jgi:2-methylcitrate dehydratase PrpD
MSGRDGVAAVAESGLGRELASFSSGLGFGDIPDDVRTIARHSVLDWLGATLAGSREDVARIVTAEAVEQGGTPQATMLGCGARTGVIQAALVNGTASHALDVDDVQFARRLHGSVSVLPAVLALAERDGRGGEDLITAFVAGVETACRVGRFVTDAHHERGHHATGTLGTFGAAAGAARLLGLDAERTATALAIAATQAAGLKAMFGTMGKPLHAGKAAAGGLHAALLAARGFAARADGIECAQGFADVHSPARATAGVLDGLGRDFELRGVLFKAHAACYSTHASIEAGRLLRAAHSIDPGAIESVEVRVPVCNLETCNILEPRTGLEAKFSLRLTSAMALCGWDTADTGSFRDAACDDPELVAVRDRVRVVGRGGMARGTCEMIVRLHDGSVRRRFSDVSRPAEDLAEQGRRVARKFTGLAGPVIGEARAREVIDMVAGLQRLDRVTDLVRRIG